MNPVILVDDVEIRFIASLFPPDLMKEKIFAKWGRVYINPLHS